MFPVVPVRIVVQALKETTDKLDDKMYEDGWGGLRASQFEDHDMDQLLALHYTALRIIYDMQASPLNIDLPPSMQTTQSSLFLRASSCYSAFYSQVSTEMLMLMKERKGYISVLHKVSYMQSPKATYSPQNMLG